MVLLPDVEVGDLSRKDIVTGHRVQLIEKSIHGKLEELEESCFRLLHLSCVLNVLTTNNSSLSISEGVSESSLGLFHLCRVLKISHLHSVDQMSYSQVKCSKKLVFSGPHLSSVAHEPGLNYSTERRFKDPEELLLCRSNLRGVLDRARGKFTKKTIGCCPKSCHKLLLSPGNLLGVSDVVATATGVADWGGLEGESSIGFC